MIVDWNRIEALVDPKDPSDIEWLKEMIHTLYENMNTRIQNLNSYLSTRDSENLRSELHQIKGVAANFGLQKLFELTQESESLIKQSMLEEGISSAKQVEEVWLETKKELQTRYP